VEARGEQLSLPGFVDKDWMIATVPGTVLTSYLNDGAIANPDFGDNQYAISDSFFCADFWYRNEFTIPPTREEGKHTWLNFDGVNWKAEIYLNGHEVGRIDGGFMRGRFDVTTLVHSDATNALAVRVIQPSNPGGTKDKAGATVNGGALGRDNPTYHASAGWDWISTIRGRNSGIWSNVSLSTSGAVTIEDPLVTSTLPLPDASHADIAIQAVVHNQSTKPVAGTLRARFGDVTVEAQVTIDASGTKTVTLDPVDVRRASHFCPEALVACRIRRAESLQCRAQLHRRWQGIGHNIFSIGHPSVHVLRRRRGAEDLDQRKAIYCTWRELGIPRVDAAISIA
jgi:hypothetical protein